MGLVNYKFFLIKNKRNNQFDQRSKDFKYNNQKGFEFIF